MNLGNGAELLEAGERPVGVGEVEELVALDAIAVGPVDARSEIALERDPIAGRPDQLTRERSRSNDALSRAPGNGTPLMLHIPK